MRCQGKRGVSTPLEARATSAARLHACGAGLHQCAAPPVTAAAARVLASLRWAVAGVQRAHCACSPVRHLLEACRRLPPLTRETTATRPTTRAPTRSLAVTPHKRACPPQACQRRLQAVHASRAPRPPAVTPRNNGASAEAQVNVYPRAAPHRPSLRCCCRRRRRRRFRHHRVARGSGSGGADGSAGSGDGPCKRAFGRVSTPSRGREREREKREMRERPPVSGRVRVRASAWCATRPGLQTPASRIRAPPPGCPGRCHPPAWRTRRGRRHRPAPPGSKTPRQPASAFTTPTTTVAVSRSPALAAGLPSPAPFPTRCHWRVTLSQSAPWRGVVARGHRDVSRPPTSHGRAAGVVGSRSLWHAVLGGWHEGVRCCCAKVGDAFGGRYAVDGCGAGGGTREDAAGRRSEASPRPPPVVGAPGLDPCVFPRPSATAPQRG